MLPTFIEKHQDYTYSGYACTNEEPKIFTDALKRKRFKRAGGICSSGEIPLFVLLRLAEEVTVIDHSYRSIVATFTKAILLSKYGVSKTRKFLTMPEGSWPKAVWDAASLLPTELIAGAEKVRMAGRTFQKPQFWAHERGDREVRREWHLADEQALRKVTKKLDKLTIIHGDLSDLEGEFDLFYLSNAHEHTGRNGIKPDLLALTSKVAIGGTILIVQTAGGTPPAPRTWEKKLAVPGYRTTWSYFVYERKE